MTLHVKDSGAWAEVSELHAKTGGAWAEVQNGYVKTGDAWVEFFTAEEPPPEPPPTLSVSFDSPGTVTGSGGDFTMGGTVTTPVSGVPTLHVTGHTGSLSYLWTRVSGPSAQGAFSVTSTTSLQPRWTGWAVDGGASQETWRITVTDSLGVTGSADIVVTLTWTNIT